MDPVKYGSGHTLGRGKSYEENSRTLDSALVSGLRQEEVITKRVYHLVFQLEEEIG
jgi:hypothetical protein